VIGAATNLGLAVVKDHRIEHLINNVFFYGGNIYGIGNGLNSASDRNVSLDVDAIHLVNKAFTERLIVVPHETALRTVLN
jgi:inosine-uridine nucleoside N-ribohydrolase